MTVPDLSQDERHSRLLDAMPAIAWSADAQTFRFNYVNPAAETILGYPAHRWIDEPNFWSQHLHPEDRHIVRLCHNETMACRNHELVYRMIAADGRTVWLRDYVNVYSVDGKPLELFGVMVDITRERHAEAAWKASRENFRRMVELSPDCIGVHVDGEYVYVNKAFVDLLGARNEAEVVGRTVLSFIDPVYHECVREQLVQVTAGRSVPYARKKYCRIDGTSIDVEVAALPLRYGTRNAVQVIARDITDRVRAEEELGRREERLQLLASGTHEAIWEWFPERKELWTNDACRELLGAPVDPDVFFEEWLSRVHPEDRNKAWAVVRHATDEESPIWCHEYRLRQEDGAYRFILDRGHTAKSSNGERRVVGAMLDVTSLRESERLRAAAEAHAQRKLEEAKRMSSLGQVAASLAHEFNNVLMGIQPFVEVIARNPAGPRVGDALGHITRSIGRGKRASQEILRFANPKEPQLSAIDLRVWLPTFLGHLTAALPATITLDHTIEPGVRTVRGDCEHLEQVITNLVFNARDAITGKGTIHVRVSLEGERVRISMCDDGPGIAPAMLDRIFEPLFTTKRNGTGLGLAIARRLMERQGGALTAENRAEGGCAFHVFVPALRVEEPEVMPDAAATPGVKRILLVEDDLSAGAGLEELLRSEGYETTWVRLAADACAAARTTQPQVAIIDVNLPDGNGVDLVGLLRVELENLPVVLSTGHVELDLSDVDDRILSLMKPYELGDLLAAIATATA